MSAKGSEAAKQSPQGGGQEQQVQVKWDTSNLKSSYANVCTVTSTREEVVLNFGINQAWERGPQEMKVELTDRIVMSPFAAMRMLKLLGQLMSEYQSRYGELQQEAAAPIPPPPGTKTN